MNPLPDNNVLCCGNKVWPKTAVPKTAVPNEAGWANAPKSISFGCGTLLSSKSNLGKTFKLLFVPSALILVLR